jgi:hypothetical protein
MKRTGSRLGLAVIALVWCAWIALSGTSTATMAMQKKAKELGFPVSDCTYCHNEKMPKKGESTYNDRGKWLMDQKAKKGASEVDVAWLKEYPADKK